MTSLARPARLTWQNRGTFLRVLLTQVLYVAPLFWFMELAQNVAWRWMNGDWGWVFPKSPYHWFSFGSLILWAGCVALLWSLHFFWFYPRRVKVWPRLAIGAGVCWVGEWVGGYVAANVFNHPLQVWPGSPLVYVHYSALFFWVSNCIVYHLLTNDVVDLTPEYDAPPTTTRRAQVA
ncbi:hypothetical protein BHS06_33930 [Myxococcus xanthus]|uniref:hypothetical protein n=1 Tax=Myxococcus TaxID=32 RepID=UPI00112B424C|nr:MULTISPECIES: hypothetical protein [Myxococcus]QDE93588.1 hypothetical protein BHS06_33930 [Myxococcus xanthus]WNZ61940.1 hypothetical protein QEG98_39935 [Myxococcus sp. MxC21-1]